MAEPISPTPDIPVSLNTVRTYARMVKLSHTIFALPFALAAVVLAHESTPVTWSALGWILLAMVGARSAAMGFNRLADADIDARNPRTADREIPTGRLSRRATVIFIAVSSGVFLMAAAMLGPLCRNLAIPVLAVLFAYSYTKRFTWLAHSYLGLVIALAPVGAWIAVTGQFDTSVLTLSAALMAYITGFDILYACQDVDFDRDEGLRSIPVRFGVTRALHLAAGVHAVAWFCFLLVGWVFGLGVIYFAGTGVIGGLMLLEHRLVNPDDLSRIDLAFFHVNSWIAIMLFASIFIDRMVIG